MYVGWSDFAKDVWARSANVFPRLPLPGRGRYVQCRVKGFAGAIHLRIGTSDAYVAHEVLFRDEYRWFLKACDGPVGLAVDLGANIGASCWAICDAFPEIETYIAVEPDSGNVASFRMNTERLRDRVIVRQAGVGPIAGRGRVDRSGAEAAFSVAPDQHGDIAIMSMSQVLGDWNDRPIDLLKVDIEGAERGLFSTNTDWLLRVRNMVVEVHGNYSVADLQAAVTAAGANFRRSATAATNTSVVGFWGQGV